jgi:hypothetical protein
VNEVADGYVFSRPEQDRIQLLNPIAACILEVRDGNLLAGGMPALVAAGTTQYDGSSLPGYSSYQLQFTTAGLPASRPFTSELVGNMPTSFEK